MQELLRLESAWHRAVCLAISHLGAKTFHVVYKNRPSALSLGNIVVVGVGLYNLHPHPFWIGNSLDSQPPGGALLCCVSFPFTPLFLGWFPLSGFVRDHSASQRRLVSIQYFEVRKESHKLRSEKEYLMKPMLMAPLVDLVPPLISRQLE